MYYFVILSGKTVAIIDKGTCTKKLPEIKRAVCIQACTHNTMLSFHLFSRCLFRGSKKGFYILASRRAVVPHNLCRPFTFKLFSMWKQGILVRLDHRKWQPSHTTKRYGIKPGRKSFSESCRSLVTYASQTLFLVETWSCLLISAFYLASCHQFQHIACKRERIQVLLKCLVSRIPPWFKGLLLHPAESIFHSPLWNYY